MVEAVVAELREAVAVVVEAMAEATVHRLRTWEVEAAVVAMAHLRSPLAEVDTAAATVVAAEVAVATTHTE